MGADAVEETGAAALMLPRAVGAAVVELPLFLLLPLLPLERTGVVGACAAVTGNLLTY